MSSRKRGSEGSLNNLGLNPYSNLVLGWDRKYRVPRVMAKKYRLVMTTWDAEGNEQLCNVDVRVGC